MLFNPKISTPQSLVKVTGRNIAHVRRTQSQRAGLAAQVLRGECFLISHTLKQVSLFMGVSVPYIQDALAATAAERAALVAGELTISEIRPKRSAELAKIWRAASEVERARFARKVGVNDIWDDAIVPAID